MNADHNIFSTHKQAASHASINVYSANHKLIVPNVLIYFGSKIKIVLKIVGVDISWIQVLKVVNNANRIVHNAQIKRNALIAPIYISLS